MVTYGPTSKRVSQLPVLPKISTGCLTLDQLLRGGVSTGSVTELAGESNAGKTQLCLQLLLTVQRPLREGGLDASAVYIFTEGSPPIRRLQQLAYLQQQQQQGSGPPPSLDRILIESSVSSLTELQFCLRKILVMLYNRVAPVKLVVVDSIANVAREAAAENVGELNARAQDMFHAAALMKEIASKYGVAVVVTNQVVDMVSDSSDGSSGKWFPGWLVSSRGPVRPALGLAWANCINSRLFVSRQAQGQSAHPRRKLQVVFCPHLPESQCEYEVTETGVRGIQGSGTSTPIGSGVAPLLH